MKNATKKIISIIFSTFLLISIGFSTNANAQVTSNSNTIEDQFCYNYSSSNENPKSRSNSLANIIDVNAGIENDVVAVTVLNIALDTLDSATINIKAYKDGRLQINRTFREYNILPFKSRTNTAALPGITHAEITVTTSDGGESYTRHYTVNA